jgi:hypothetical protein
MRRYNEQRLHSDLGLLTPGNNCRGNPQEPTRHGARKLRQAPHHQKDRNLEPQLRTLP